MANISQFRASMTNGMARANTFEININFPTFVQGGGEATRLGAFHCKAGSLPESVVAPIPVYFQGRASHVAGERSFQPWNCSIYNENFLIRNAIENWQHGINDLTTNGGIIQPALYTADILVKQLDRNGTVMKSIKLINAFPIQLSPIQLDFENNNTVEVFDVTWQYDYYESSGINTK